MKRLLKSIQMGIVCLLVACGGGGGGDANSSSNASGGRQQIVYQGASSQSELTQKNAMRFASNAYSLLDLAVFLSDVEFAQKPWFLNLRPEFELGFGDKDCASGSISAKEENVSVSKKTIAVVLDNCVMDGVRLHGSMRYTFDSAAADPWVQTTSIEYLLMEEGSEILELSGSITYAPASDHRYTGNLTAKSRHQDRTFKLDSLDMTGAIPAKMNARFYDSREGFVQLALEENNTIIHLIGQDSLVTVAPILEYMSSLFGYIQHFRLTLGNYDSYSHDMEVQLSPDAFVEWPYRENLPPEVLAAPALEVTRLENLDISADTYIADATDFVKYELQLARDGEPCTSKLDYTTFRTAITSFDCQGAWQLTIKANDGVHQVQANLPVTVSPRAATFVSPGLQELQAGFGLNLPLVISNEEADGPFLLRLQAAPAGLRLDQRGVLEGEPQPLLREGSAQFNVTVEANNGKTSTVQVPVAYSGLQGNATFTPAQTENRCGLPWQQLNRFDDPVRICLSDSSYFIEAYRNQELLRVMSQPFWFSSDYVRGVWWKDFNDDGREELLIAWLNELAVVDVDTNIVIRRIRLPFDLSFYNIPAPIRTGVKLTYDRILIHKPLLNQTFVVDLVAGTVQPLAQESMVRLFEDFNGDNDPDMLLDNGEIRTLQGESIARIDPAHPSERFILLDRDGAGDRKLVRYRVDAYGRLNPLVIKISSLDDLTGTVDYSIENPIDSVTEWMPGVQFLNVDGQPGQELLLKEAGQNLVHVFALGAEGLSWQRDIMLPAEYSDRATIDLQLLADGTFFLGNSYRWSDDSQSFVSIVDSRPQLFIGDGSQLFREASGQHTLFLKSGSFIQRLQFDAEGNQNAFGHIQQGGSQASVRISSADVNSDGRNEFVFVLSGDDNRYRIVDAVSGNVMRSVGLSARMAGNAEVVNIDGIGAPEVVAGGISDDRCLALYRVGQAVPYQTLHCGTQRHSQKLPEQMKIADLDGDGLPELIDLEESADGFLLRVYSYLGGQVRLMLEHRQLDNDAGYQAKLALQDVDGDGKIEILVWFARLAGSAFYAFDGDGLIRKTLSTYTLQIPDVLTEKPSPSVIAMIHGGGQVKSTALCEISPVSGSIIWQSKWYAGSAVASGLHVLGDNVYAAPKILVTDDGLLQF